MIELKPDQAATCDNHVFTGKRAAYALKVNGIYMYFCETCVRELKEVLNDTVPAEKREG